jgi:tripartite-type tricarboxylate transporter receptor subunit TctC
MHSLRVILVVSALAVAGLVARPADAADFYSGKTIAFIIGSSVGGGYDTYSRLIANHIGDHLPGHPTVVPQNMPGAGGIRAANYLYNVAPKDGTAIGMVDQSIYLDQILNLHGVKVDATKFNWIGRILSNSAVLFAWHTAPDKTIQDVFKNTLIVSTSGAASKLNWTVLKNLLGMKFRIITGYKGSADAMLAMERGEVQALSMPWPELKTRGAELLRDKKINLLLQTGLEKHQDLQDVPRMIDLARNDNEKKLLALFSSGATVGRSVVAPPDLPAERVKELRQAFSASLKDPALLKEVKQRRLELDPMAGDQLQSSIADNNVPPALIARARQIAEVKD